MEIVLVERLVVSETSVPPGSQVLIDASGAELAQVMPSRIAMTVNIKERSCQFAMPLKPNIHAGVAFFQSVGTLFISCGLD